MSEEISDMEKARQEREERKTEKRSKEKQAYEERRAAKRAQQAIDREGRQKAIEERKAAFRATKNLGMNVINMNGMPVVPAHEVDALMSTAITFYGVRKEKMIEDWSVNPPKNVPIESIVVGFLIGPYKIPPEVILHPTPEQVSALEVETKKENEQALKETYLPDQEEKKNE